MLLNDRPQTNNIDYGEEKLLFLSLKLNQKQKKAQHGRLEDKTFCGFIKS